MTGRTKSRKETRARKKHIPMFKVILHNDDVNSFDHVIVSLMEIFKFDTEKAVTVTLEAHKTGTSLVKIEPYEHAELHRDQLQSASLTATIEPA